MDYIVAFFIIVLSMRKKGHMDYVMAFPLYELYKKYGNK